MGKIQVEENNSKNEGKQYITFQIGAEVYGLELISAKEIIKMTKITNVPNTDEYIMGVINLRGQIVPVINLREKLNLETDKTQQEKNKRIVIIDFKGLLLGLLIDGVREIVRVNDEEIENVSATQKGIEQEYIKGVCELDKSLVIIISLAKILEKSIKD